MSKVSEMALCSFLKQKYKILWCFSQWVVIDQIIFINQPLHRINGKTSRKQNCKF
jgi:hypothetical protein